MLTRRTLLKSASAMTAANVTAGTLAAVTTMWPERAFGKEAYVYVPNPVNADDTDLAALAAKAVDAAQSAGASYADVRITRSQDQRFYFGSLLWREGDLRAVGVRVLVDGVWGFYSSARWTTDEMTRLAQRAVEQAKANATANVAAKTQTEPPGETPGGRVALGTIPVVTNGNWTMPVKYDPFEIPVEEKRDIMGDLTRFSSTQMHSGGSFNRVEFERQHKVFASSEGSTWTQTTYMSLAEFSMGYRDQYSLGLPPGGAPADVFSAAGKGWEHITDSGLIDIMPQLVDAAEQSRHRVPVEIGRYDLVLTAEAMAALVDSTVGAPTELDRAFGYEANASGSSFLQSPLEMLNSYQLGSPLLTVSANRSLPGGAATVKWDDDSVVPEEFTLVKDGILVDYQTTREQARWLAPYYTKIGTPIRSHGCARAESAGFVTMQHSPNLRLLPGTRDVGFDDLVSGVKSGIAVLRVNLQMDQQYANGVGFPAVMRRITNGKLGLYLDNAGLMFRTAGFWKNLSALGGPKSERVFGFDRYKGEPGQHVYHSVAAVPGIVTNVSVIDALRRA